MKTQNLLPIFLLALSSVDAANVPINTSTCEIEYSTSHGTYPGTRAFDGSVGSGGRWLANRSANAYVQVHFKGGLSYAPHSYTVVGLTGQVRTTRVVKDFLLKASNDGENWVLLDQQTEQVDWGDAEERTFDIASTDYYSWFRFEMPANNGATDYTGICELILHYEDLSLRAPCEPTPANQSTECTQFPVLSWLCQSTQPTFKVFFGTEATLTDEDLLIETDSSSAIPNVVLKKNTTYYWRVDVSNELGDIEGDVWSFTTHGTLDGLVAEERFESYNANKPLAGQGTADNGWTSKWLEPAGGNATVVDAHLEYDAGAVFISGGEKAVRIAGNSNQDGRGAMRRHLEEQTISPLYMSFLVRGNTAGSRIFALLMQNSSVDHCMKGLGVNVGYPGGKISAESDTTDGFRIASSYSVEADTTYFIVVRMERTVQLGNQTNPYTNSSIFVNPVSREEPSTGWVTATIWKNPSKSLSQIFLRTQFMEEGDEYLFDELRIGHSYASVVPYFQRATIIYFK